MKYLKYLEDDKRVVERLIEKKIISEKSYKDKIDNLSDESNKIELVNLKDGSIVRKGVNNG